MHTFCTLIVLSEEPLNKNSPARTSAQIGPYTKKNEYQNMATTACVAQ